MHQVGPSIDFHTVPHAWSKKPTVQAALILAPCRGAKQLTFPLTRAVGAVCQTLSLRLCLGSAAKASPGLVDSQPCASCTASLSDLVQSISKSISPSEPLLQSLTGGGEEIKFLQSRREIKSEEATHVFGNAGAEHATAPTCHGTDGGEGILEMREFGVNR